MTIYLEVGVGFLLLMFGRGLHLISFDICPSAGMSHICGSRSGGITKAVQCYLAP
jgi:hypothetical protein